MQVPRTVLGGSAAASGQSGQPDVLYGWHSSSSLQPLTGALLQKCPSTCHPEPFGFAQGELREGSGVVGLPCRLPTPPQILRRCAPQNDSFGAGPLTGAAIQIHYSAHNKVL